MPGPAGADGAVPGVGDVPANVAHSSVEDAFAKEMLTKEVLDAPETAGGHCAFLRIGRDGGTLCIWLE